MFAAPHFTRPHVSPSSPASARLGRLATAPAVLVLLVIVAAWGAGALLSDRYAFSQWLAWIPAPIALLAALLLAICSLPWRGVVRGLMLSVAGVALLAAGVSTLRDHRPFAGKPDEVRPGDLVVTHWNPQWITYGDAPDLQPRIDELHEDVTILTNAYWLARPEIANRWREEGSTFVSISPFVILSRLPVIEARLVIAAGGAAVALVRLDAKEQLGRPLVIYAVDLPSSPRLPRMALARQLHAWIDDAGLPAPDLVVGDLNMTRDSAAITTMFPGLRNAFTEAGRGLGMTYPREFPLWAIDHVLVGDALEAADARIIDPGSHGHRAVQARVRPRPSPAPST